MAMPAQVMHPVSEFGMTFTGDGGSQTYEAVETKESRNLEYDYEVVYDVSVRPHTDILMGEPVGGIWSIGEQIAMNWISDEVLIAWNVWLRAGVTLYSNNLAKKWPPISRRIGSNHYEVRIRYAPLFIVNFQTAPVTTKRKTSIGTMVWRFPPGGGVPTLVEAATMTPEEASYHNYINVDKQGIVQGVDIGEPTLSWTERWEHGPVSNLLFTNNEGVVKDYIRNIGFLESTVNDAPFRGFSVGQVLFRGVSGRRASPLLYEIDYAFAARPLRPEFPGLVGGEVVPIPNGWAQCPWNIVETDEHDVPIDVDGTEEGRKSIGPNPIFAKIHQIHGFSDFSLLKIQEAIPLSLGQHFGSQVPQLTSLPNIHEQQPPVIATTAAAF